MVVDNLSIVPSVRGQHNDYGYIEFSRNDKLFPQ